ncbi:hypothetical protein BN946_scf184971.g6 [Trametes cinnabarina]|uniref:Uncharacterized protein n=1 Tax=Pycnoporus cinnabarinus TaxID=5643 RepID=A0A060SUY1_PYCCI|nr:hypothetical protein BN946_scf184971.g6 [Trametes cinnabarina]
MKQARGQAPPPAAKHPSVPAPLDGAHDNVPRKASRKMASVESDSQRRPQSSFNYIAPLLRGPATSTKSAPPKPLYLSMQEKNHDPFRTPRKILDDGSLFGRNASRVSVGAMSVQRRPGVSPRKAEVPNPSRTAGQAQRQRVPPNRRAENVIPSSSESSPNSDEWVSSHDESPLIADQCFVSDDIPPRIRLPGVARKTAPSDHRNTGKAARKRSVDADAERLARSLGKAARKLNISSDADADSVIELSDEDEDIGQLLEAFDALTLGLTRLRRNRRLPYLRRNLRVGFEDRCIRTGIPTHPAEDPGEPVKVVYRYRPNDREANGAYSSSNEDDYQEWVGTMTKWICPLCPLYPPFNNRAMLAYHISRDHSEVKASWEQIHVRNKPRWRITLLIPDYEEDELEESSSEEQDSNDNPDKQSSDSTEEGVGIGVRYLEDEDDGDKQEGGRVEGEEEEEHVKSEDEPEDVRDTGSISRDDEGSPSLMVHTQTHPAVEPPALVRRESETPEDIKPVSSIETTQQPESRAPTISGVSLRGSLPDRYPTPPPPEDPMGPAAQYPYLEINGDNSRYSCRIGGPRIYDLLNELSLDEFGIMSWAIVDREEELFEMDDVRDEDKVMLALWNRWIMLNGTHFILNKYENGVQSFLDQYWRMIHNAAGWRALRAFLMMLHVHKYLTLSGVTKMLKYYEEKTGMKLWYKDAAGDTSTS